jgi:hypothetical protein
MGVEPMAVADQFHTGRTMPHDSPGKPRPVGSPKPKLEIAAARRPLPSIWAILMVPMFDDWAMIWVAVSCSVGCVSASWNKAPPTLYWFGTEKVVVGVMSPSWSAVPKVTILKTDPGSKTRVTA